MMQSSANFVDNSGGVYGGGADNDDVNIVSDVRGGNCVCFVGGDVCGGCDGDDGGGCKKSFN